MGLSDELPPITGLVLTSPKENELVEIPIVSPLPTGQVNPVLAHWTYGLGRSVAFTSDAGRRWAKAWPDWESYAAFWSQVVRWSMRPADRGNLTLNVRREEGRIKVVVDALDKDNQFLNFLQIQGNVVDPDLKSAPIELVQTAPGPVRGDDRERRGERQLLRQPRLSRPRQDPGRDLHRASRSPTPTSTASSARTRRRSRPLASLTDGQVVTWKTTPDGRIDLARTIERRRPLPPRPGADQSPLVRGPLADAPLAGGLPVPGRRRRAPDRARHRPDQAGRSANEWRKLRGQRRRARAATTWTSSGAARPRSASSSTGPGSRPGSRPRAARLRPSRASRGGRASRCSRGPGPRSEPRPARPAGTACRRGPRPRRPQGRGGQLHQPPAQGQAAGLGRTREGKEKDKRRARARAP